MAYKSLTKDYQKFEKKIWMLKKTLRLKNSINQEGWLTYMNIMYMQIVAIY